MDQPNRRWQEEPVSGGGILMSTIKKVVFIVLFCGVALFAIEELGRFAPQGDEPKQMNLREPGISSSDYPEAPLEGMRDVTEEEFEGDFCASEMTIRASGNGQFMVDAEVNGETVQFLVDTGASKVVLTPQDARRVGFSSSDLDFSEVFSTANGDVTAAPVELRSMRIGPLEMDDVEASVNGGPLAISLLGMTFLNRLEGYEIDDDRLILAW